MNDNRNKNKINKNQKDNIKLCSMFLIYMIINKSKNKISKNLKGNTKL